MRLIKAFKAFKPLFKNKIFRVFLGGGIFISFGLGTRDWVYTISTPAEVILFKIMFYLAVYAFLYFTFFSIIDLLFERAISFHEKYNRANLHRQPIKGFISKRVTMALIMKTFFTLFLIWVFFIDMSKIVPYLLSNFKIE
jgi:hypothetical protein